MMGNCDGDLLGDTVADLLLRTKRPGKMGPSLNSDRSAEESSCFDSLLEKRRLLFKLITYFLVSCFYELL